jgi:hypothetical protein
MIGVRSLLTAASGGTRIPAAHSIMLLIGGSMAFVVVTVILEGGDHFVGFRLFQQYAPMMSAALLFYVPLSGDWSRLTPSRTIAVAWPALIAGATLVASYSGFPLTNNGIKEDFPLARDGRRVGVLLNELAEKPAPDVGVLPAGGIAANPVGEKQTPDRYELSVFRGLMDEKAFRDEYRPVLMHLGEGEIFAYARKDFIAMHRDDPHLISMSWERFRPPEPAVSLGTD